MDGGARFYRYYKRQNLLLAIKDKNVEGHDRLPIDGTRHNFKTLYRHVEIAKVAGLEFYDVAFMSLYKFKTATNPKTIQGIPVA